MDRPIFLVSSERSGSTLLRVILDSHPRICAPSPTHLLAAFAPLLHLYGALEEKESVRRLAGDMREVVGGQLGRWRTSPSVDELVEHCRERSFAGLFDALYSVEAERRGKKRYFIKDNGAAQFAFFINAAFPDASFVYLVRDARDVVASWLRSPPHFGGTAHAAEVWAREQEEALLAYSVLRPAGRMHLLHYEDLVNEPEGTLAELCRFLGEEYSPTLLGFHRREEARESAAALDAWRNVSSPIGKERVGAYRRELAERQVRIVESIAAGEMRLLGYALDYPERLEEGSPSRGLRHNRYVEALLRFFQLLSGRASRREAGRRATRLRTIKSVERIARKSALPWSAPGTGRAEGPGEVRERADGAGTPAEGSGKAGRS